MVDQLLPEAVASGSEPREASGFLRSWSLALVLAGLVVAVFWPVLENGWVDCGDSENFLANHALRGLKTERYGWTWSTMRGDDYQPLSWWLTSLERSVFGLGPRGYHAISLAVYAIDTMVLFALSLTVLKRFDPVDGTVDGSRSWSLLLSAAAAVAIFSVHPLRVELVAWASAQPYLMSSLFLMLSVPAYLRAHPTSQSTNWGGVAVSFLLFLVAVLLNSIAVALPLILLILDVDPLRRLGGEIGWLSRKTGRVWLEKLPFFVVGAVFARLAVVASQRWEPIVPIESLGLLERFGLETYSGWFYIAKTFLPRDIAVYYPGPDPFRWQDPNILACSAGLVGVTAALGAQWKRHRGLTTAWFAFLAVLSVNPRIVLLGDKSVADRFSYVPMIGLTIFIAGVFRHTLGVFSVRGGSLTKLFTAAIFVILLGLASLSRGQIATWRDSLSLWIQAYQHGGEANPQVRLKLMKALIEAGDVVGARNLLKPILDLVPKKEFHMSLYRGLDGLVERRQVEAERDLLAAIEKEPDRTEARLPLGRLFMQLGRLDEAISLFRESVRIDPHDPWSSIALGQALLLKGRFSEAADQLAKAAAATPYRADVWGMLAVSFAGLGRSDEALSTFRKAVEMDPANVGTRVNFGSFLLVLKQYPEAIEQYKAALERDPDNEAAKTGRDRALSERDETRNLSP